jgi:transcriptional regulator with PAS, ATPase and Fis domain
LLVVPVYMPPLRERKQDIPELIQCFFERYKLKYHRDDLKLPSELIPYFSGYHWPGNVRQLENSIERIVLLSGESGISPEVLPDFLHTQPRLEVLPINLLDAGLDVEAVEHQMILGAMQKCQGNQTHAARLLNMSRRAFAYRLKKYGLLAKAMQVSGHMAS